MTQDEIIEMARQAGIKRRTDEFYSEFCDGIYADDLQAFAKLVAEKTLTQRTEQEPVIDKSAAIRIATALGWTPPRTWVDLTAEEVSAIISKVIGFNSCVGWEEDYARAIMKTLKEKNI